VSDARRRLGALAGCFFILLAPAAAPASAAGSPSITGTVVNGTTDGPEAGLAVVLHEYGGQTELDRSRTRTDGEGRFSFDDLDTELRYDVTVSYLGAEYRSPTVRPGEDTEEIELRVFETTRSTEDLRELEWVVWVDPDGDGVAIQHDVTIENSGERTYVGKQATDGDPVVVSLPLATGAANFQYLGTFLQCCATLGSGTFEHSAPLAPGRSSGTVRYSAPTPEQLSLPATLPTDRLTVLVRSDLEVEVGGLTESESIQSDGFTYRAYEATGLQPGGRAASIRLTNGPQDVSILPIAIGAGAVVALAFTLALLAVLRRGRAPRTRTGRPGGPKAKSSRETRADGRRRARASRNGDEEEADLLIEEIAALDVAKERGVLDEETHRKLRALAKKRLLRVRAGSEQTGDRSGR